MQPIYIIHITPSHLSSSLKKQSYPFRKVKPDGKGRNCRLYPTVHVKDQVLGNIFRGTFSDSFRQNLPTHPHSQGILQSTSCQVWNFCLLFEFVY